MNIVKSNPRAITFLLLILTLLYCHQIWRKITEFDSTKLIKKETITFSNVNIFDHRASFEEKANAFSRNCFRKMEDIARDKSYFIGKK